MTNKQKLNKLCNIRTDLTDDSSHISTINSAIQSVADDFVDFIKSSTINGIKSKIEDLKEPYQSNDSNIKNAKSYCQYEINIVDKELKAEKD